MTPFEFGQKIAAESMPPRPVAAVKQPVDKAVSTVAKSVPGMLNMARSSGQNVINILNPMSHAIRTRTGEHPTNWELTEALMQGLPYPYPAAK